MRLRIDLAYDGGDFHGWAAQPGLRTVQGELEAALAHGAADVPPASLVCAGRTDTGVHARGQVVHLDLEPEVLAAAAGTVRRRPGRRAGAPAERPAARRRPRTTGGHRARRLRRPLLPAVAALRLPGRPTACADPLTRGHVLAWPRPLDVAAVNAASTALLGLHDFAAFCKQREGATTVRTLLDLAWVREGDLLTGTVRADAFCHHMVRSLVGCLLAIGEGRRPVAWAGEVLAAGVRDPAVTVVPPHGLTLEEVGYPPDADARRPRRRDADEAGAGVTDHYFSADPSVPFAREPFTCEVWGQRLDLVSGSGVYSRGRLDVGTAVLFRETEPPAPGLVLDLGTGYGVIGLSIAASWRRDGVPPGATSGVTGVEVNQRAVLLANENAAALGLSGLFSAREPDAVPADLRFDEIWSNPPIRIGKQALHDLLLRWFVRLRPGGRAVMVVGKNLGGDSLQAWLTDRGYPTTRLASAKGFRVLESRQDGEGV